MAAQPDSKPVRMLDMSGEAWCFGDNIPTDEIVPTRVVLSPMVEVLKYVLVELKPEFPKRVKQGDIIVAGHHFGQSSGRAIAPKALKALGIGCIVAESFARTFLRNCYEIGLPILECRGVSKAASDGDKVRCDLVNGVFENVTRGIRLDAAPCQPFLLDMLRAGGVIPLVKAKGAEMSGKPV